MMKTHDALKGVHTSLVPRPVSNIRHIKGSAGQRMGLATLSYHFCTNGSVTRAILRPRTLSNGGTAETGLGMRLCTHLN